MSETIDVPPLVGHKEVCQILGVQPGNLAKVRGLPPNLQSRQIKGFEVASTPLWPRAEIEAFAAERARKRTRRGDAH